MKNLFLIFFWLLYFVAVTWISVTIPLNATMATLLMVALWIGGPSLALYISVIKEQKAYDKNNNPEYLNSIIPEHKELSSYADFDARIIVLNSHDFITRAGKSWTIFSDFILINENRDSKLIEYIDNSRISSCYYSREFNKISIVVEEDSIIGLSLDDIPIRGVKKSIKTLYFSPEDLDVAKSVHKFFKLQ